MIQTRVCMHATIDLSHISISLNCLCGIVLLLLFWPVVVVPAVLSSHSIETLGWTMFLVLFVNIILGYFCVYLPCLKYSRVICHLLHTYLNVIKLFQKIILTILFFSGLINFHSINYIKT